MQRSHLPLPTRQDHPNASCRNVAMGVLAIIMVTTGSTWSYQTENVVVVIIDGVRYTEGFGDTAHAYVPNQWELAQEGAIIEPFLNDGYTYTSRAIPAIWCGAWTEMYQFPDPDCGGDQNSYCRSPTVFEYYRKQLSQPEEQCIYVLKDVGCPWKASFDPDYGPDYWPVYHSEGYTDLDVWDQARSVLDTYEPAFLMLYLAEVDGAGHSENWAYYTGAIATADRIVGELWDYLQANPAYAGRTTMFVTNDHGRHSYDWTGHGCDCEGCRRIQLLAIGPDIMPGLVSTNPRTLRDITPTVGELLGFEAEDATGTPLLEILRPEVGTDEQVCMVPDALRLSAVGIPLGTRREFVASLPIPGFTVLTIRTLAGHTIARPFEGWLPAGEHVIRWDVASSQTPPTPGVYIATVESGATRTSALAVYLQ